MKKFEITDSQPRDPEYNSQSSKESIYSMDKSMTESIEDNVSVGKFKLSDSSTNKPEGTNTSLSVSTAEVEQIEVKLDKVPSLFPSSFLLQLRNFQFLLLNLKVWTGIILLLSFSLQKLCL